ncbi:MAG: glycosyltransferase family 4 protein [Chloroflexi bacterium]|nr:glycosyltransferase family 4 protein [Chloroflexota bacterium]
MNRRIVLDARLLHYNQTGIGRYIEHLYGAMALLAATGEIAAPALTALYHRNDTRRALAAAWPRSALAATPAHHRWERWTLAVELARLRPHLVHSPDHVCPQPLGWRSVVTVHDLAFRRLPETHVPESRQYYAGLDRSVRQATRVICVSHATKADLLAHSGVDPAIVRVVYEAPGPLYDSEGPMAEGPRPYFVCVGTIEPRKNVARVVQALSMLPVSVRPELRIIGAPGSDAGRVHALVCSLALERDIRFLGRLADDEIAAHYRGALALVYPSLLEGFGLPILEAMACGAPVITADRSSTIEVAGDAAEVVDPENVAALAAALRRLTDDPARRAELRRRGLARTVEFGWSRAARETFAVFEEALAA